MTDLGGILWLVIDVVFVGVLAAVLAYAVYQWRRRPRDAYTREVSDEAVRKQYHRER